MNDKQRMNIEPKLTSVQFCVDIPYSLCPNEDPEAIVYDMIITKIRGFLALDNLYPYDIDIEFDDDDGETISYIVIIHPIRKRGGGGLSTAPRK